MLATVINVVKTHAYKLPDYESEIAFTLEGGDQVEVVSTKAWLGKFVEVKNKAGETGYINKDWLSKPY